MEQWNSSDSSLKDTSSGDNEGSTLIFRFGSMCLWHLGGRLPSDFLVFSSSLLRYLVSGFRPEAESSGSNGLLERLTATRGDFVGQLLSRKTRQNPTPDVADALEGLLTRSASSQDSIGSSSSTMVEDVPGMETEQFHKSRVIKDNVPVDEPISSKRVSKRIIR